MINELMGYSYCRDDITKIHGYEQAVADKEEMWVIHHCLGLVYSRTELIMKRMYYNQPAEMLVFCTKKEHQALHHAIKRHNRNKKHKKVVKITTRKIQQMTKNGMMIIAEYDSIKEAAERTNTSMCHICNCCKGRKKTANGFRWRYVE